MSPRSPAFQEGVDRLGRRSPVYLLGAILVLAAVIAALLLFLWMVRLVGDPGVVPEIDLQVQAAVAEILSPGTIRIMGLITVLGGTPAMTLFALVGTVHLWRRRRWRRLAELMLVIPVGAIALFTMKAIFQRTRPVEALLEVRGLSFPSGHAFMSMVFFGFLVHLLIRSGAHAAVVATGTAVGLIVIALVGISRVYLGVHFLTDVIGGYAAGFLWLVLTLLLVPLVERRFVARRERRGNRA